MRVLTIWREGTAPSVDRDGTVEVGVTLAYAVTDEGVTLPAGVWNCTRPITDTESPAQTAIEMAAGAGLRD